MNISEIASMAGVSVSAVSRYLNNGYISEEKRTAIKAVIDKTGYQPSQQARILRTKKSNVIGVIVPKISSEAIGRIVSGIHSVLTEHGYQMLLTDTENDIDKEIEYLQLLDKNPVDGIIFVATIFQNKHKTALDKLNVPVVIIGQKYENYACVYHDDYQSARELTELMLKKGRGKLACLSVTEKDRAAGLERKKGFLDALKGAGMEPENIAEVDFSMEDGHDKMQELLEQSPDLDGVFCATDMLAIGAMEYLKKAGREIPGDISIAGVGHTRMSRVITPRLATAHLHYKTSGIEGTRMLLEMIGEGKILLKQIKLGYEIVEAESI